jgi:hypothetical protein
MEIVCSECAHCIDLRQPKNNDPAEVQKAHSLELYYITKWLTEYKDGKYSPILPTSREL